jgi:hypothetical protein
MTTHKIKLHWDHKTDQVTVTYNNLEVGDEVIFVSDQGQAMVIFPDGNPFSASNDSLTIADSRPRSVIQLGNAPFVFKCSVQIPEALNASGGGEVPHPHTL